MHRRCLALALLLTMAGSARALTVQLSADRTRVGVGDVFSVTVAMTIEDGADVPTPGLHLPPGFDLMGSQSSTSTSISIVNGAVSQTRTVNVVRTVRGNKEGTFTLGPAEVESGAERLAARSSHLDPVNQHNASHRMCVDGLLLWGGPSSLAAVASAHKPDRLRSEAIASAVDGFDRMPKHSSLFQLLPEPTDMRIDGA